MKNLLLMLFIVFLAFTTGRAQNSSPDFLISQEDTSCRFDQATPTIFADGARRFLVIWQDTRNGTQEYFAQLFDSLADPVGSSFCIFSNSDVAFLPDNSFLVMGGKIVYNGWPFDDGWYYLDASICGTDGSHTDPITLGQCYLPWCGTGFYGYSHDISTFQSGYLCAFNASGDLTISKRRWDGDTLWTWHMAPPAFSSPDSFIPVGVSTCFNSAGDFAAVYFGITQRTALLQGIAGTFFDSGDSVIARNVIIRPADSLFSAQVRGNSKLKIVPLSDSLYEVFVLGYGSDQLVYWRVDRAGKRVGNENEATLQAGTPTSINSYTWVKNLAVSPQAEGKFSLFACIGRSQNGSDVLYRSLLNFDRDGNMVGTAVGDSTTDYSFAVGNQLAKMSDGSFLLTTTVNNAVYLNDYRDFSLQWTKKVSEPMPGSNDILSRIVPRDSNTFFVMWKDQKGPKGKALSLNGYPLSDSRAVPTDGLRFLSDGRGVALETALTDGQASAYVYNVYDSSLALQKTDTLVSGSGPFDSKPVLETLKNQFFILYRKASNLKLRQVNASLDYREITIPTSSPASSLKIVAENDTSFWIGYNGKMRLVSKSLQEIGGEYVPPSGGVYLGGKRFLIPSQEFQLISNWGRIVSIDGDTLTPPFPISEYADQIEYLRLSGGYFLVMTRSGNNIYIRTFGSDGSPRIDPLLVSPPDNIPRSSPDVCKDGNKLLVAWSEARTPGRGYDVYGRLFDIDKLTGITDHTPATPLTFALHQNYPNPFNPTTTISYQLSAISDVRLTIYDVLGRKVETLVNSRQAPGGHSVVFNGRGLASGVYFCLLQSEGHTLLRKMILMK